MKYYVYDTTTGKITKSGTCMTGDLTLQAGSGEAAVAGVADDLTQWFNPATSQLEARPTFQVPSATSVPADGSTLVSWAGLPNPTDVNVTGPANDSFQTTDGALDLTFDAPGDYTVRLSSFPYQDLEVVISAT